ncbi:hypothetical protein BDD12DRAFT_811331 [Trichophaea hybrida]|nr:hypothetical protein BDD12DRAFT_811331 [Trichophaea hybrida]
MKLSFTEEENRAWRDFVFGSSSVGDLDEDELFVLPPSKLPSGKYFTTLTETQAPSSSPPPRLDGRHFTALTATQAPSSPPPRIELAPFFPVLRNGSSSSVNATQGSSTPIIPRSLRIAKSSEAMLEDSLAGNATSSPSVRDEPTKFG